MCEMYRACFSFMYICIFFFLKGWGMESRPSVKGDTLQYLVVMWNAFGHSFIEQRQAHICVQQSHQVDSVGCFVVHN